ncbi:MAG: O-antigen ligase family protein [Flavobacteriales bacterium]|nr:O-antigen ligase family protein [Flavobacteriales bacterium]MDG1767394.1 O-antigen ligase family protein [Flavobacteriales bacterium]
MNKKWWQDLSPIGIFNSLTVLIAFLLPITKKGLPMVIAFWALMGIWSSWHHRPKVSKRSLLSLIVFYVLHLFGLFQASNIKTALFHLEVKASFLLFPVIWLLQAEIENKQRFRVMMAFVYGCLFYFFYSFAKAFWRFQETAVPDVFFYNELADYFHPTYIATYFALGFLMLGWLAYKQVHILGKRWVHHLMEALFLVFIGLLSSKAGYLCALMSLGFLAILWLKRKRLGVALTYAIMGTFIMASTIMASPKSQSRIKEMTNSVQAPPTNDIREELGESAYSDQAETLESRGKGSTAGRIIAWEAALVIIAQHPFGVGTADATNALKVEYEKMGASYNLEHELNAHNQFLQSTLEFGYLGFLSLAMIFVFGIRSALRRNDFIFLAFMFLLFINMLFESFWEVQSGVVFVSFFFCFFVCSEYQKTTKKIGAWT